MAADTKTTRRERKPAQNMEMFAVRIPSKLRDKLDRRAERQGVTVAHIVRQALTKHLR